MTPPGTHLPLQEQSMSSPVVIFDFGGVLMRTEDHAPRARLAEHFGMAAEELTDLVFRSATADQAILGRISAGEHWRAVARRLGWPEEELPALQRAFWGGDELDETLVDFLRSLRRQCRTALLSNAWDNLRPALKEMWQLDDAFDHIFISAEMGLAKPDPAIYAEVAGRLQSPPRHLFFVDDLHRNVAAARQSGWTAVQFQDTAQAMHTVHAWLASR